MALYRVLTRANDTDEFKVCTWGGLNVYGDYSSILRLTYQVQQLYPHNEYRIEEHYIGDDTQEQEQSRLD